MSHPEAQLKAAKHQLCTRGGFVLSSMSDLAPFVAATLRDKVVADLLEEIERLRDEIKANNRYPRDFLVEITGPNRTPIYSRCTITREDLELRHPRAILYAQSLDKVSGCSLGDFAKAQVWVNGSLYSSIGQDCVFCAHYDRNGPLHHDFAHIQVSTHCKDCPVDIEVFLHPVDRKRWLHGVLKVFDADDELEYDDVNDQDLSVVDIHNVLGDGVLVDFGRVRFELEGLAFGEEGLREVSR